MIFDFRHLAGRLVSRKLWVLCGCLAGSGWASWWITSRLIQLRWGDKITEPVFQTVIIIVIATEALFVFAIAAWWMWINIQQKRIYRDAPEKPWSLGGAA